VRKHQSIGQGRSSQRKAGFSRHGAGSNFAHELKNLQRLIEIPLDLFPGQERYDGEVKQSKGIAAAARLDRIIIRLRPHLKQAFRPFPFSEFPPPISPPSH
jgi:hypothetical protein